MQWLDGVRWLSHNQLFLVLFVVVPTECNATNVLECHRSAYSSANNPCSTKYCRSSSAVDCDSCNVSFLNILTQSFAVSRSIEILRSNSSQPSSIHCSPLILCAFARLGACAARWNMLACTVLVALWQIRWRLSSRSRTCSRPLIKQAIVAGVACSSAGTFFALSTLAALSGEFAHERASEASVIAGLLVLVWGIGVVGLWGEEGSPRKM